MKVTPRAPLRYVDQRFATGARVLLTAAGATQMREVGSQPSYLSQEPPGEAHFGTGDAAAVERLEIRRPSGRVQRFFGLRWRGLACRPPHARPWRALRARVRAKLTSLSRWR